MDSVHLKCMYKLNQKLKIYLFQKPDWFAYYFQFLIVMETTELFYMNCLHLLDFGWFVQKWTSYLFFFFFQFDIWHSQAQYLQSMYTLSIFVFIEKKATKKCKKFKIT